MGRPRCVSVMGNGVCSRHTPRESGGGKKGGGGKGGLREKRKRRRRRRRENSRRTSQLLSRKDGRTRPASSLSTSQLISLSSEAPYSKIRLVWILNEQIPLHYGNIMWAYPTYLATALAFMSMHELLFEARFKTASF